MSKSEHTSYTKKQKIWRFLLLGQVHFLDNLESSKTKFQKFVFEILWALVVALTIRSFLFQPHLIPTGSMIPTILVGDFIFSNKYTYGYTKHSFPLQMIPIEGRVFANDPKVGDIILFNNPKDGGKDYVKRCVARGGDRVQMIDGYLYINGEKLSLKFIKDVVYTDERGVVQIVKEYEETLPNGVIHPIYKKGFGNNYYDNTPEYVVPEGHFFGMGDNRDNSMDSREMEHVGFIPHDNLLGKGVLRWMSIEHARWWAFWEFPWSIRFSRIGTLLK